MASLSPRNVALTDQILATLAGEGGLPVSTIALLEKISPRPRTIAERLATIDRGQLSSSTATCCGCSTVWPSWARWRRSNSTGCARCTGAAGWSPPVTDIARAGPALPAEPGGLSERDRLLARLTQAWLNRQGSTHTQTAYRRDLTYWVTWCHGRGLHPLDARLADVNDWLAEQRDRRRPAGRSPGRAAQHRPPPGRGLVLVQIPDRQHGQRCGSR